MKPTTKSVVTAMIFMLAALTGGRAEAGSSKKKNALPPLKWLELEAGLSEAKSKKKPAVVVFTTKKIEGPGTLNTKSLRKALTASRAIPIRVLPPGKPKVPKKATPAQIKKVWKDHRAAQKKYQKLRKQYQVAGYPTMLFMTPEADLLWRLNSPREAEVTRMLAALPKLVEQYMAAKAKAAEKAKPRDEKKPEKPAKAK